MFTVWTCDLLGKDDTVGCMSLQPEVLTGLHSTAALVLSVLGYCMQLLFLGYPCPLRENLPTGIRVEDERLTAVLVSQDLSRGTRRDIRGIVTTDGMSEWCPWADEMMPEYCTAQTASPWTETNLPLFRMLSSPYHLHLPPLANSH